MFYAFAKLSIVKKNILFKEGENSMYFTSLPFDMKSTWSRFICKGCINKCKKQTNLIAQQTDLVSFLEKAHSGDRVDPALNDLLPKMLLKVILTLYPRDFEQKKKTANLYQLYKQFLLLHLKPAEYYTRLSHS